MGDEDEGTTYDAIEPSEYIFQPVVREIEKDLSNDDEISCLATYQANLYIGTARGRLLHYHKFEDADDYMVISQLQVSNNRAVRQILLFTSMEKALVLSADKVAMYSLPEFSPLNIGKLKGITGMSKINNVNGENKEESETSLLWTKDKIRVISVTKQSIKLLKDINYSNTLACVSTSIENGKYVIAANESTYVILDLENIRQIPLFEHNSASGSDFTPQIIPFGSGDSTGKEFLLLVKSDQKSLMGMFMNANGEVTRGTLLWENTGYPFGAICVDSPYILALFKSDNLSYRIITSSLVTLQEVKTQALEHILAEDQVKDKKEESSTDKPSNCFSLKEVDNDMIIKSSDLSKLLTTEIIPSGSKIQSCITIKSRLTLASKRSLLVAMRYPTTVVLASRFCKLIANDSNAGAFSEIYNELKDLEQDNENLSLLSAQLQCFILAIIDQGKFLDVITHKVGEKKRRKMLLDPLFVLHLLSEKNWLSNIKQSTTIFSMFIDIIQPTRDQLGNVEELRARYLFKLLKIMNEDPTIIDSDISDIVHYELYSKHLKNPEQVPSIVVEDLNYWNGIDFDNNIIKYLEENNVLLLIEIYKTLLENLTQSLTEDKIAERLCSSCLSLISDSEKLASCDGKPEGDLIKEKESLIDLTLHTLKKYIKDPKIYGKYLFEILKVTPQKGVTFIKNNRSEEYKDIHKQIMSQINFKDEADSTAIGLTRMKFEYAESVFIDDLKRFKDSLSLEVLDEFLAEALVRFTSKDSLNQKNLDILNNLKSEYSSKREDIGAKSWPKINWIDFLSVKASQLEEKLFFELYVKIYELILIRCRLKSFSLSDIKADIEEKFENNISLRYLLIMSSNEHEKIEKLLEFSDYQNAEYVTIKDTLVFPAKTFYLPYIPVTLPKNKQPTYNCIKKNLYTIFKFYSDNFVEDQRLLSIIYFHNHYEKYFTPLEAIGMIPKDIPIIYLKKYLDRIFVDYNIKHTDILFHKAIGKADSKFMKKLSENHAKEDSI
ncbi:Piso0_005760 [Millerozyma farinosa CBS 7064]|uniref:Piso0_005760 protein n=1 Tax=Pichia sorbitophila (strain ATCC MYA-4447 / BCRC 22081 / CBS 7064 / NBRC 10061 / NRRL Y-12695) TaxID=559304 RepID=G8Y2U9_PICSO|nr:Piso0_005760 [Millerozyma farinosa CBS 7064]